MGIQPGIFLAMPIDAQKPILFHRFNKAFLNPGDYNDVDEFYGIISWDNLPLAVRLDPTVLFTHAGDGTLDNQGALRTYFTDVDSDQLFAATDTNSFANVQEDNQGETLFLRRCIPVPPVIALMMLDSEAKNAHQLGAEVANFIRSVRQEAGHELQDIVNSVKGRISMKNILAWLFKVQTNMDLRIICSQVFPGDKIDRIARALRNDKLNISNNAGISNNTSDSGKDRIIQSNLAIMQELIKSQRKNQDMTHSSSDKGFQKLPSAIQAFLLAVGSQDLESSCEHITKTGLELLKMLNKRNAIYKLSRLLKKDRGRYKPRGCPIDRNHLNQMVLIS